MLLQVRLWTKPQKKSSNPTKSNPPVKTVWAICSFERCLGRNNLVDISKKKLPLIEKELWVRVGIVPTSLQYLSSFQPPKYFFCSMYTWPFICSIIINVQLQIFIQSDIWMVECLMWMNWWKKNNLNEASFSNHKTFYPALLGLSNVGMNLTLSGQASFMLHSTFVMLFFSQMRSNILGWSDNSCVVLNFSAENVSLPPPPFSSPFSGSQKLLHSSPIPTNPNSTRCKIWAPAITVSSPHLNLKQFSVISITCHELSVWNEIVLDVAVQNSSQPCFLANVSMSHFMTAFPLFLPKWSTYRTLHIWCFLNLYTFKTNWLWVTDLPGSVRSSDALDVSTIYTWFTWWTRRFNRWNIWCTLFTWFNWCLEWNMSTTYEHAKKEGLKLCLIKAGWKWNMLSSFSKKQPNVFVALINFQNPTQVTVMAVGKHVYHCLNFNCEPN